MRKQEFYRQEYGRLKPDWRDSQTIYRDIINKLTTAETHILDVGCGHGDFMKPVYDKTIHTYGVDPDKAALDKNTFIQNKIVGDANSLPFKSDFFDIAVSAWVLEHLPDPKKAFKEIYRVLKPGGKVVFLTPNSWNYNVWIIRLIPEIFHEFLTKRLYDRQDHDTYPKKYKINSVEKIKKTLGSIGFNKSQLILNGDPSYISFNRPLFAFARFIEKVLDLKPFRFGKVHIIGVFEK